MLTERAIDPCLVSGTRNGRLPLLHQQKVDLGASYCDVNIMIHVVRTVKFGNPCTVALPVLVHLIPNQVFVADVHSDAQVHRYKTDALHPCPDHLCVYIQRAHGGSYCNGAS